jgi:hypothetical protein
MPGAWAPAQAQGDTHLPDRKRWREVEVVLASQKKIRLRLKPIIVPHGIEPTRSSGLQARGFRFGRLEQRSVVSSASAV